MSKKWSKIYATLSPERKATIEAGVAEATREMVGRRSSCGGCAGGWRCYDHPDLPSGHEGCQAGRIPCCHPDCPPFTGIACKSCERPVAGISRQSETLIVFSCPGCGHVWHWDDSRSPTQH